MKKNLRFLSGVVAGLFAAIGFSSCAYDPYYGSTTVGGLLQFGRWLLWRRLRRRLFHFGFRRHGKSTLGLRSELLQLLRLHPSQLLRSLPERLLPGGLPSADRLWSCPSVRLASGKPVLPPTGPRFECDDHELPQPRVRPTGIAVTSVAGKLRSPTAAGGPLRRDLRPTSVHSGSQAAGKATNPAPSTEYGPFVRHSLLAGATRKNPFRPARHPDRKPQQRSTRWRPAGLTLSVAVTTTPVAASARPAIFQRQDRAVQGDPRNRQAARTPQRQIRQLAPPDQSRGNRQAAQPRQSQGRSSQSRSDDRRGTTQENVAIPVAADPQLTGLSTRPATVSFASRRSRSRRRRSKDYRGDATTSARTSNPPCRRRSGRHGPFGTSCPSRGG